MSVISEFSDANNNTYQIIDWESYVEISLVLVNISKRDGSIMILSESKLQGEEINAL